MESLQRIAVGIHKDKRVTLNSFKDKSYWNNDQNLMNTGDFEHYMAFYAFDQPIEGTKRVAVGRAGGPERAMLDHSWED